tara:strand:- start:411 stop:1091 length:681 start_codon:yes stop_codon:yes gene_type:complete
MELKDKGYLLSKNQYQENSSIAEFFTENHGKISGIIFGASSKKLKNYLQIGNKFTLNFNLKKDDRIGYLKVEIEEILTPFFFEDKKKLSCVISALNLIKILTVDFQENKKIYQLLGFFFEILKTDDWLRKFIFWELEFFKLIGYHLELKNLVNKEIVNGKTFYYVKSEKEKKIVPNFLIETNFNESNTNNLFKGLKLVGDYLNKSILKPNNLPFPKTRTEFAKLFK